MVYRNVEQYPNASNVHGILILEIDAPIYFANTNYLRKRITRWINDEEDRIKSAGESSLQCVILDITAVGNIDTSGISMFEEVKKLVDRRSFQVQKSATVPFNLSSLACTGEPRKRGDEEDEQVRVD